MGSAGPQPPRRPLSGRELEEAARHFADALPAHVSEAQREAAVREHLERLARLAEHSLDMPTAEAILAALADSDAAEDERA